MSWDAHIEPVHALGITLRDPITLGHVLLLDELGSPLIHGGEAAIGDVALAVFVCAYPAHVARRRLRQWTTRLAFRIWSRFWRGGDDVTRFCAWFNRQIELPEMWHEEKGGRSREMAAPWWINRITLAMNAGLSFREATEMPMRSVNLLIASKLEASGVCEFVSRRQRDYFDQVDEWMRQGIGRN